MHDSLPSKKLSVGQALARLRRQLASGCKELGLALNISHSTYLKIERDERDLSFLMALRVCQFYDMDIHDFIAMIDDAELERKDLSTIKMQSRRDKKKAEREKFASRQMGPDYKVPGMTYKPLYKMDEVCQLFNITLPTIYDWIKHGKLKPKKIRSRVFFLWTDIQELLQERVK